MQETQTTPWSSVGYLTYKRCVEKTTPVLTAKMEWKPAHELTEGEEIVVFDDNLTANNQRYIRIGKVEHNEVEKAQCVGVVLSNGETVYCTPDHSWLVAMASNKLEWREAKDLLKTKKGGPVLLPKLFGETWGKPDSYKAGYLAAAYDGEGSLDRTNSICFTQVQNSMLTRVEDYLKDFGIDGAVKKLKSKGSSIEYKNPRQDCFDVKVIGFKNIVRILGQFGSSRLTEKLKSNLEKKPQRMRCDPKDFIQVVDVFDAGEMEISVLSTSHGTHFTAGYPSHNTYARRLNEQDTNSETEEWKDTVNRVVSASQSQLKCNFTTEEETRLKDYMLQLKGTVAGRFLWQLGTETVGKLGLASLQNCFSGDTEVLTDSGVKTLKSIVDLDFKVFSKGVWSKATAKAFGKQELYQFTFSPAGRSNHKLKVNATKNHRWELTNGSVTDSLKLGDKVLASGITLARSEDGFKHGLIFGDGSISYRYTNGDISHSMRLCGKKEQYKDLFAKYIYQPNCDGDPVVYERSSYSMKDYPPEGSSPEYISSFIKGWIAADGSVTPAGSIVVGSTDDHALEYLTSNAPFSGYVVSGYSYDNRDTNFGKRNKPVCKITLTPQKVFTVEQVDYLGEDFVYCAVVPGVERFTLAGGLLTCNCAFVTVDAPVRPFTWAMDMLMLGSGVGYNIQKANVDKLPKVRKNFKAPKRFDSSGADFIVPDTREGWVALLGKTLKAAFLAHETGHQTFTYSTQLIRGKGAPIKGFGGTASGPEDLCWGIEQISKVLEKRKGKKVRPIDCLDIMNIIGAVVVAGNVRRSAQIAIGDADDVEFLLSKRWDMGTIPSWRAMSNNSVVCNDISELHDYFWEGYEGKGEPFGLINLELSRKVGRLGDTNYPDPDVQGYNP